MKQVGVVKEYNGFTGRIKGVDGIDYLLRSDDVLEDTLSENEHVSFEVEQFFTVETNESIARFIESLDKKKNAEAEALTHRN